jgi:hypothetical protein
LHACMTDTWLYRSHPISLISASFNPSAVSVDAEQSTRIDSRLHRRLEEMKLRAVILRVRALAAPRRVERELEEELAFHIERETRKHIAAGLSPSTLAHARWQASARCRLPPTSAATCAAPVSSTT